MTNTEFSNQFDVLYNNLMSNQSPALDEYEKSVLLTKAQNELIKDYYNPKGNKYEQGFDDSAKRQIDFSELISSYSESTQVNGTPYDTRGKLYKLPKDLMIVIQESINTNNGTFQVIPIKFSEYMKYMSKPFKEPTKWQAWRLITDANSGIMVEIIPHTSDVIKSYNIRYIRRPKPIVLVDLNAQYGTLSIDGISEETQCELNPILHEEILQRAVELAKVAYVGDVNSLIQTGQRSE